MADRTFESLRDEVLHDDFGASKYRTRAEEAINDALREIARRIDLPSGHGTETVTLSSGTQSYSLPSGFSRVKTLIDETSDSPLDPVDISFFEQLDHDQAGTPEVYALYGSQLLLWPTPNATRELTLRYRSIPSAFTDTSDPVSSVIPDDLAHLVVKYARHRLFALEDDQAMADFWRKEFERDVAIAKGDIQSRNGRTRKKIGTPRRIGAVMFPRYRRP